MFVVDPPQVVFPPGLSFRLPGEAAQTETGLGRTTYEFTTI